MDTLAPMTGLPVSLSTTLPVIWPASFAPDWAKTKEAEQKNTVKIIAVHFVALDRICLITISVLILLLLLSLNITYQG